MYNTVVMTDKLEILKKRLIYRASYRGTKEMDILLSSFVNKYINEFDNDLLDELNNFLNYDDEIILNYYQNNIAKNEIDLNKVSKIFKSFKI